MATVLNKELKREVLIKDKPSRHARAGGLEAGFRKATAMASTSSGRTLLAEYAALAAALNASVHRDT